MKSRSGRRSQRTWFGLPECKEAKFYQRAAQLLHYSEVVPDGGQPRPGQAAARDRQWQRGVTFLVAMGAPSRMAAMLMDLQGYGGDLDLLDHDGLGVVGQEQMAATRGTGVQQVVGGDRGEPLGGEGLAVVGGRPRLAAGPTPLLARRRLRLGGA